MRHVWIVEKKRRRLSCGKGRSAWRPFKMVTNERDARMTVKTESLFDTNYEYRWRKYVQA